MTTIRLVLSIVASDNLHQEQLDVKTSFLHGDIDEDIYMTQREGFQSTGKEENLVCKLKKSLLRHGIDQEAQETVVSKIRDEGFSSAKQILGMSIIKDKTKGTLRLSHEKYIGKVLEKFNMKDVEARCQPLGDHFKLSMKQTPKTKVSRRRMAKVPYASAVGSVICQVAVTLVESTSKATLYFSRKKVILEGFFDSDYEGCLDLGKSTTDVIHLEKNPMFHGRAKHIKIRYHYIRELVSEGTLSLKKIFRAKNPADMLTKVVTTEKLKLCAASTSLRDN
ncbi:retrovirus-related pol polyprotein from transposon TNT 1-94 [Tanacetum coccineum]